MNPLRSGSPPITLAITSGSVFCSIWLVCVSVRILAAISHSKSSSLLGLADTQALDLHLADGLADPLRCSRLARPQEDLGHRLAEHRFGFRAVPGLHLTPALESQQQTHIRLPPFGERGRKLRQFLQARQFVEHDPDRRPGSISLRDEPQNQGIEPQADDR